MILETKKSKYLIVGKFLLIFSFVFILVSVFLLLSSNISSASTSLGSGASIATGIPQKTNLVKTSSGALVAFWCKSNGEITATKSTNEGLTWTKLNGTAGTTIIIAGANSDAPSAFIDASDNIYVTYNYGLESMNVKLTYTSNDWTIGTPKDTPGYDSTIVRTPSGRVYWAYSFTSGRVIIQYTDNGTDWGVSSNEVVNSVQKAPQIVMYNGNPAVFYSINKDLYWKTSDGSPTNWSAPMKIVTTSANNTYFQVVVDSSNNINLVYADNGIKYKKYNGVSWNSFDATISSSANDTDPKMTIESDGNPMIVWSKYNSATDYSLVYKRSNSGFWDTNPTTILSDSTVNRYVSILSNLTTNKLVYMWTKGNNPYNVIVDSVVLPDKDLTAPLILLTALSPDPTNLNTPSLQGAVSDTEGTIISVQYQMDGTSGNWLDCSSDDGSFNSQSELFTCQTLVLADGSHTIYIRASDSNGNTDTSNKIASDIFLVDTTAPTTSDNTDSSTHTSSVTITLNCSDNSGTGCLHTYYTTDGSNPTISSAEGTSISLTTNGNYTIKYFSVDSANNSETVKTSANVVKIKFPEAVITSSASSISSRSSSITSSVVSSVTSSITEEVKTVSVKLVGKDGLPITGARVELHTDIQVAYTDNDGIATFNNVVGTDHDIVISYGTNTVTQKVNLLEDTKTEENSYKYSFALAENNQIVQIPSESVSTSMTSSSTSSQVTIASNNNQILENPVPLLLLGSILLGGVAILLFIKEKRKTRIVNS